MLRLQEITYIIGLIAGNYLYHWINVTCEKVAKNGPNLKKLAQKISNWRMWWRKKNPGLS